MKLTDVARETLAVVQAGGYRAPGGGWVDLAASLAAARAGTQVYTPSALAALPEDSPPELPAPMRIEVSDETTQVAARRLAESHANVGLLNFASAKNPGGGFVSGARAQEEDLARCSGLYPCLAGASARSYYAFHRAHKTHLYSHHMILSPSVPFFRTTSNPDVEGWLLRQPFLADVITAPAPNAGMARKRQRSGAQFASALAERAGYVLALASHTGVRSLVLGAWGCGVFKNDPRQVADSFQTWLESERFATAFERVVFAVPTQVKSNHEAFVSRCGPPVA